MARGTPSPKGDFLSQNIGFAASRKQYEFVSEQAGERNIAMAQYVRSLIDAEMAKMGWYE